MEIRRETNISFLLVFLVLIIPCSTRVESRCDGKCNALASYFVLEGTELLDISQFLSSNISAIRPYNPQITNPDIIDRNSRVNVPFSCGCAENGDFLSHEFDYRIESDDTYSRIAGTYYANLTTADMLKRFNSFDVNNLQVGARLNVPVNCSCGNKLVSKDYGLFITYLIRPGENLSSIASQFGLPEKLLSDYNPDLNFSNGSGLAFIPGKDENGTYPPLKLSSRGISGGVIAGISVAGVVGALLLAACFYFGFYRRKNVEKGSFIQARLSDHAIEHMHGITMDKSVEFLYEELAKATDDFSLANKIGQGGYGSVYYGLLRGEKAAIKKMDMQASKEFLAELKVLTHVHHFNLIHLIGYSVESSLCLVYEFIENGNLSQHLSGSSGRGPLSWSSRMQIALDSARGLEYIHEHTVPVYIHHDIKSANILIDENFHAKVANFGLTKLTEVGTGSLQT